MELENLTIEDIEDFFWKAAKDGWGSGKVEKQKISSLPGYKCIPFESGRFSILDAYCVTPLNDKSAGMMTIWFDKIPVWIMHYGGEYPEQVIPFLKLALQDTIMRQDFIGGRGPKRFVHGNYPNLLYVNTVDNDLDRFSNFSGLESIFENGHTVGHHYYRGMSLI